MAGERMIEMTWVCTSCSNRNLGRYKQCQNCRNPKDGSERYEMPADTTKAVSVTEESLLRMASAGPDWRCAYCGSDQRRTDQGCASCGASAVEGAEATDAGPPAPVPASRPAPLPAAAASFGSTWKVLLGGLAFVFGLCALGGAMVWIRDRPRDFEANVVSVSWERNISVERWQVLSKTGFKEQLPATAFEVKSIGQKQHHTEDVLDHYETEHYQVEVPNGFRTETYSERVSCGQDCTTEPQRCHEECTNNRNGFASCRQVCSGGGQHCSTRYCNQTRTRQVPQTRMEDRTRKVPRYRAEPRFAEAFSFKNWEWKHDRSVPTRGTDVNVRWGEAALGKGLAEGEKEREQRTESYEVRLAYDGNREIVLHPTTAEELAKFAPQTKHQVHTEKGVTTLDGVPLPQ